MVWSGDNKQASFADRRLTHVTRRRFPIFPPFRHLSLLPSSSLPHPLMVSLAESFFIGGIAACTAVTISNPAEVAKVRLQLQGELAKNGGERVYKSAPDVFVKTWRNEGIRGLQRGLVPAVSSQLAG